MRRTIREKKQVGPSTRLSTVTAADPAIAAHHRHAELGKLINLLCGDLDFQPIGHGFGPLK